MSHHPNNPHPLLPRMRTRAKWNLDGTNFPETGHIEADLMV